MLVGKIKIVLNNIIVDICDLVNTDNKIRNPIMVS